MGSFKHQNPSFQKWMALLAVGFISFAIEGAALADPADLLNTNGVSPVQNYINETQAAQAKAAHDASLVHASGKLNYPATLDQPTASKKFKVAAPSAEVVQEQEAAPVVEQPTAPAKFRNHEVAAPLAEPVAQPVEQPAMPAKFRSHPVAAPVADVEQTPAQAPAAPVLQATTQASTTPDAQPAVPHKFRVKQQAAPVPQEASQPVVDQPTPSRKFQVRAAVDQPQVPSKLATQPSAPQVDVPVETVDQPPRPVKFRSAAKGALVRDDAAPDAPAAPTAQSCPSPITAQNSVAQVSNFGKTLNETLADVKPQTVPMDEILEHQLDWGGDDHIDALDMAKMGVNTKHPLTPAQAEGLSAKVKNLLKFARKEAERQTRFINGRSVTKVGSKRACLQGVRMAFQEATGQSTKSGWTNRAKDAGPFLKKYGWQKAPAGKYNEYNAPVGAVLIYDVPGYPNQAGHIEIKGTDGYYSDFYSPNPVTKALGKRRRLIGVYVPGSSD